MPQQQTTTQEKGRPEANTLQEGKAHTYVLNNMEQSNRCQASAKRGGRPISAYSRKKQPDLPSSSRPTSTPAGRPFLTKKRGQRRPAKSLHLLCATTLSAKSYLHPAFIGSSFVVCRLPQPRSLLGCGPLSRAADVGRGGETCRARQIFHPRMLLPPFYRTPPFCHMSAFVRYQRQSNNRQSRIQCHLWNITRQR